LRGTISVILFAVQRAFFYTFLTCAVLISSALARGIPLRARHPRGQQSQQQSSPEPVPPRQQSESTAAPPTQQAPPAQPPLPAPVHFAPVVVLDPGHGGTDPGAHGGTGVVEKDVVLQFARALRAELERLGYRVVMTRNDDSNPSYDDRAALSNAYRDPVFVSLHVSSTGTVGTARAYFYQFSSPSPAVWTAVPPPSPPPSVPGAGITWEEAQRPYGEASRRLANLVEIELTHRFAGSPNAPTPVAARSLRSVAAAAVAVEISSVAISDPTALTALTGPLASSVARGVAAFRPIASSAAGQP
jgi:N-acetylmuramoyl-L-alanine amidase